MATDIIARGMIGSFSGDILQLSEKVNNHTDNSNIHVTESDKENWNSHPNDVMASGNPVQIDGLQGGVPFSEMVVKGKNLLKYPYVETTKTQNGITFTVQSDGGIKISGTLESGKASAFTLNKNPRINGTVCMSGGSKNIRLQLNTVDNRNFWDIGSGVSVSDEDVNYIRIFVTDETEPIDTVIYPQIEIGDTATEYEPPITGRELQVNMSGKNLIPTDYMAYSGTRRGVTVTVKNDGRVDLSGTATSEGYILDILMNYPLIGGKKYTFSCSKQYDINTFNFGFTIKDKNGAWKYGLKSYPATIIADEGDYIASWRLWANNGVEYSAENVEIQMEIGDTATEYETPVGSKITITPDSNPYIIPNDIRQQDGLNVVSISEGELSVVGVRKNAALKKLWDEIDEIKTAIIVSNGESE